MIIFDSFILHFIPTQFFTRGYPSGIEKTILILILLSHIYFDRPSCADHEYDIFIPIWFSNKKNIIDVPDFELYSIFSRKCVFCWHLCPWKLCFSGFSTIQSVVLYLYLEEYSNALLDFFDKNLLSDLNFLIFMTVHEVFIPGSFIKEIPSTSKLLLNIQFSSLFLVDIFWESKKVIQASHHVL